MPSKKCNQSEKSKMNALNNTANTAVSESSDSLLSVQDQPVLNSSNAPQQPVDLTSWPGWVDLLSEPAHFNTLLREFGVRGVKIHEVIGLELEDLVTLPQPVHALIFLFRWKQSDRAEPDAEFPDNVWFAEQTADNACATYALLNIVNNIPGLNLGAELQDFKQRTAALTPFERGEEVNGFHFVRAIHNSFATKADLREADKYLRQAIAAMRRAEAARIRKVTAALKKPSSKPNGGQSVPTRTSGRLRGSALTSTARNSEVATSIKRKSDEVPESVEQDSSVKRKKLDKADSIMVTDTVTGRSEKKTTRRKSVAPSEAAHHFCAYMPIGAELWRLDGLEPTPEKLGDLDPQAPQEWLHRAANILTRYMAGYDDGSVEFNIMAVVHDPLLTTKAALIENVKAIQAVERKLTSVVKDWHEAQNEHDKPFELINGVNADHDLSQYDIDAAAQPTSLETKLEGIDDLAVLLEMRKQIADHQPAVRADMREELKKVRDDESHSRQYRHDYDEFFDTWFDKLAEVGWLETLVFQAN